jgi:hypothetical protein
MLWLVCPSKSFGSGHLDTVDVCNESDQPFDLLKEVLLGQFGKSKWQSYFELLWLAMEMQGLKPSILMGKLKQHFPRGVSPDNNLVLSMFLIRLPLSMWETVGARNQKTAMAMVKAANTLRNARGGYDPIVAATMTQHSRSLASTGRKKNDGRNGNAHAKSRPPSGSNLFSFQNPGNGMCKFHNFYDNKAHMCIFLCSWSENESANSAHATG